MRNLKKLLRALSAALLPMLNAFVLLIIIASICGSRLPLPSIVASNITLLTSVTDSVPLTLNDLYGCADAMMGVSIFGAEAPEDFGLYDRAFLALFRITAGETWISSLDLLDPDGTVNWDAALFTITYIMVVNWVVLQVCHRDYAFYCWIASNGSFKFWEHWRPYHRVSIDRRQC